ncbi:MAG: hypothetical protein VYC71_11590, partial [Planctomycetota bacterium]|nr:hypothetical protein [Planctomycetota bacterium]
MKCLSERQGFFFPRSEAEETPGSSIFIRSDKRPKPGRDAISRVRYAERLQDPSFIIGDPTQRRSPEFPSPLPLALALRASEVWQFFGPMNR